MTIEAQATTGRRARTRRPVVVGVDGSDLAGVREEVVHLVDQRWVDIRGRPVVLAWTPSRSTPPRSGTCSRRHGAGILGGFAFGSVARAVLHHAETPVVVVPAGH